MQTEMENEKTCGWKGYLSSGIDPEYIVSVLPKQLSTIKITVNQQVIILLESTVVSIYNPTQTHVGKDISI